MSIKDEIVRIAVVLVSVKTAKKNIPRAIILETEDELAKLVAEYLKEGGK